MRHPYKVCSFLFILGASLTTIFTKYGQRLQQREMLNQTSIITSQAPKDIVLVDAKEIYNMEGSSGTKYYHKTPGDKTKVLLVTHYRGGSTFLGELFAQSNDTFYWFEPLHSLLRRFNQLGTEDQTIIENSYYKLRNDTLRRLPKNITDIRLDILTHAMNCDVTNMDIRVLEERVLTSAFHAPSAIKYATCARPKRRQNEDIAECIPLLQKSCDRRQVTVAKTVRTPMYLVDDLLEVVPDLKVIYSTRDPRAVLNSRSKEQHYMDSAMVTNVHNLCLRMKEDYKMYEKISSKYPGRILHISYENLAQDPTGQTEQLYQFIDRKMPKSVRSWIINNTNVRTPGRGHSTNRNSTQTSVKWQKELKRPLIDQMTDACRETLKLFGYI